MTSRYWFRVDSWRGVRVVVVTDPPNIATAGYEVCEHIRPNNVTRKNTTL